MRYCCAYMCCNLCFCTLITLFNIEILYNLQYYDSYQENICLISKIDYPRTLPNISENNWVKCSCGKKCKSWKPCIELYSTYDENLKINQKLINTKQSYSNIKCTIADAFDCYENVNNTYYQSEIINIFNTYLNKNITCYVNENIDNIYLKKEFSYGLAYTLSVFIIISLICIICLPFHK